jgi:hypothetical protein
MARSSTPKPTAWLKELLGQGNTDLQSFEQAVQENKAAAAMLRQTGDNLEQQIQNIK